jgi:hypothetical protein
MKPKWTKKVEIIDVPSTQSMKVKTAKKRYLRMLNHQAVSLELVLITTSKSAVRPACDHARLARPA